MLTVTIIIVVFGLIGLFWAISQIYRDWEFKRNLKTGKAMAIKTYSEIRPQIKIPSRCLKVHCMAEELNFVEWEAHSYSGKYLAERNTKFLQGSNYIWKENESICFFPTIDCIDSYSKFSNLKFEIFPIKIKEIVSYEKIGELYHENRISGGGGGGSSIGNAVIGGAIAGSAGAIIASRKKTEAISSELIEHDERKCNLIYVQDDVEYKVIFHYSDYEIFRKLIPEKDIRVLNKIREINAIENHTNLEVTVIHKIRNLGILKDEGLLTQEEFEEKKKYLLNKM
jgi:hypothetical protein